MNNEDPRLVAVDCLRRIERDEAWTSHVLDAERMRVNPQRRAFLHQIVFGTLRSLERLDNAYAPLLSRPKLDNRLRAIMRLASYELIYMRTPAHASVNAWVDITKRDRGQPQAKFLNAILRKLARNQQLRVGTDTEDVETENHINETLALPAWQYASLHKDLGENRLRSFLEDVSYPLPVDLHVGSHVDINGVVSQLREDAPASATVDILDPRTRSLRTHGLGDIRAYTAYKAHHVRQQEYGAQLIAYMLGAMPGQTVGDFCCGHGGKTLTIAQEVGDDGRVIAVDNHPKKLVALREHAAHLNLHPQLECHAIDLSKGAGGLAPAFDRILIDAPCTGTGALHRRPELMLRRTQSDTKRLIKLQKRIVENAAPLLKPGGYLLYAVCSLNSDEAMHIAESPPRGFVPVAPPFFPFDLESVQSIRHEHVLTLGPWLANAGGYACDGYQIVTLRKQG